MRWDDNDGSNFSFADGHVKWRKAWDHHDANNVMDESFHYELTWP